MPINFGRLVLILTLCASSRAEAARSLSANAGEPTSDAATAGVASAGVTASDVIQAQDPDECAPSPESWSKPDEGAECKAQKWWIVIAKDPEGTTWLGDSKSILKPIEEYIPGFRTVWFHQFYENEADGVKSSRLSWLARDTRNIEVLQRTPKGSRRRIGAAPSGYSTGKTGAKSARRR